MLLCDVAPLRSTRTQKTQKDYFHISPGDGPQSRETAMKIPKFGNRRCQFPTDTALIQPAVWRAGIQAVSSIKEVPCK